MREGTGYQMAADDDDENCGESSSDATYTELEKGGCNQKARATVKGGKRV